MSSGKSGRWMLIRQKSTKKRLTIRPALQFHMKTPINLMLMNLRKAIATAKPPAAAQLQKIKNNKAAETFV